MTNEMPLEKASPDLTEHFLHRAVMIPEVKTLYVPTPKSACSSILWALSEVAGLPESRFGASATAEVTPALTIHDMSVWGMEHRPVGMPIEDLMDILDDDTWLRFTVVRDPIRRLWSAWQSKVLAWDPQMMRRFGSRAWFPQPPRSPDSIVSAYREFVRALGVATIEDPIPTLDDSIFNSHWAPQTAILGGVIPRLNHVGRLEELDETVEVLSAHLGRHRVELPRLREANRSLLPFAAALHSEAELEVLERLYAHDLATFGYSFDLTGDSGGLLEWSKNAEGAIETLQALAERHERIEALGAQVSVLSRQVGRLNDRLASARRTGREVGRLRARVAKLEKERTRLRAEGRISKVNLTHARNQVRSLERQLDRNRSDRHKVERLSKKQAERIDQLERGLRAIKGSFSWRITAPLRVIRRRQKALPTRSQGPSQDDRSN